MNDEFQSIDELYQRVLPALRTKVHLLEMNDISFVCENDIWNLLMDKWKRGKNLTLFDIVDDILRLDEKTILENYENYKDEDK